jgi:hypothetical protein
MKLDRVLTEIREVREAYSMRFAGNVRAMAADLRAREREGGRTVVSRPAKQIPAATEAVAESR